jgi:hypothetical protein
MKSFVVFFAFFLCATFNCISKSSETISDISDEYYPIHKSAPYYSPSGKTDAEIIAKIHQQLRVSGHTQNPDLTMRKLY